MWRVNIYGNVMFGEGCLIGTGAPAQKFNPAFFGNAVLYPNDPGRGLWRVRTILGNTSTFFITNRFFMVPVLSKRPIVLICLMFFTASLGIFVPKELFMLLFSLTIILLILKIPDISLQNIMLLAFFTRLIALLVINVDIIKLPGEGGDINVFEYYGWEYAQAWRNGADTGHISSAYTYYSGFIGVFYYYFGRSPEIVQLVNIVFGLLKVWFVFKLTSLLTESRIASLVAALVAALFTPFVLYSVILHREMVIMLLIVLSLYYLAKWMEKGHVLAMLLSLGSVVVSAFFHGAMLLVGWVHLAIFTLYNPQEHKIKPDYRHLLVIILSIIVIWAIVQTGLISYKLPGNIATLFSLETFQSEVENRLVGRTQYLEGLVPESYFDVVWQTPLRVVYFMFTPFPWMIETKGDLYVFFETIFYLILLYFSGVGVLCLLKKKKYAAIGLTLSIITLIVLFSWGTSNFGTAWRHRAKVAPMLITLAATGIAANKKLY